LLEGMAKQMMGQFFVPCRVSWGLDLQSPAADRL
jgi:hypothetical protein